MNHHPLNPSRFRALVTDQQPLRPERFESRKSKEDERWCNTSPKTVYDRIAWCPMYEPKADRAPICPSRSISPKQSKKPAQSQGELNKFLSFIVDLDVTDDADNRCTQVTSIPSSKDNTKQQDDNLVSSTIFEAGGRTPTFKRFADKTSAYRRLPRPPLKKIKWVMQLRSRKVACSTRFEDLSSISFSDLDLETS